MTRPIRLCVLWDTIGSLYFFMLGYGLANLSALELDLQPDEEP